MGKRKPTAIDLFCGCGGTTQGLKDAGFRVLAGVESDPLAAVTYRRNHRGVKLWNRDIRAVEPRELMAHHALAPGDLDLLAGCPPCQAFSRMRRLNGGRQVRDKAGKDLVLDYLRFVTALRPKSILMENVPSLMQDHRFKTVFKELRLLGYVGDPSLFNAADYGVPQRRRRMLFIASRLGKVGYASPDQSGTRPSVRDAIGNLPVPGGSGDELHDYVERRDPRILELIKSIPRDGGSRMDLGADTQLRCHIRCNGFKDVYGRMAWNQPAPTITGGCVNPSKGRFLHPEQDRAITLREAALLQGFPSTYFFSLDRGKYAAALMIGNAFPPRFVAQHAAQIRGHLERVNGNPYPMGEQSCVTSER